MEISENYVVTMLLHAGGKMRNSDIVGVNCEDPVEKKRNRDLIKNIINTVAVVKELEDGKYIVLKKKYHHLLDQSSSEHENASADDLANRYDKVQDERSSSHFQGGDSCLSERNEDREHTVDSCGEASPTSPDDHSPILLALQRSRGKPVDLKPRKSINFVRSQVITLNESSKGEQELFPGQAATLSPNKPCALPLRLPLAATHTSEDPNEEDYVETSFQGGRAESVPSTPRNKRRPSVESWVSGSPLLLRRGCKNSRPAEQQQEQVKHSLVVPLERSEHDWLVKSAAGQWEQVYGLLLHDVHLAQKSDFISGFTALHWAAKCGNSSMVTKIIELSRRHADGGGGGVDVNARSHGGYTALHIAALHDQEYIMSMLVNQYEADTRVRDNSGKRAYCYLHKGVSHAVRELLGEPPRAPRPPRQATVAAHHAEREDGEVVKGGHHPHPHHHKEHHSTLSRLFQAHAKAKPKLREVFYSASEDIRDAIMSASEEIKPKLREAFLSVGEEQRSRHTDDTRSKHPDDTRSRHTDDTRSKHPDDTRPREAEEQRFRRKDVFYSSEEPEEV
ncbi:ankyrin repeat domain-containing protein SOWAHA-like [Engraulis encrasicolus]|uniref:ankyrin repeat domain-containing protein SOWAHA-like n=1 Tax=Engraulis encrasicolus TaxID=184585 RepID=UPI002FD52003